MGLKLLQDHIAMGDSDDPETVFSSLEGIAGTQTVCHEGDPNWKEAILNDIPSLLSLRKNQSDSSGTEFQILNLNLLPSEFKVLISLATMMNKKRLTT